MDLPGRRIADFSFNVPRTFVGIALLPCVVTTANYAWNWGLFSGHDKGALAGAFAALFLTMRYLGPTVEDVRTYRATFRQGKGQSE